MPNIASILKNEISRVARKEMRGELQALKRAVSGHRSEIALLKRRTQDLEQQLKRLARGSVSASPATANEDVTRTTRFSAKSLASHRKRLGLTADDCGRLLGASGQSVHNWESGKSRPRPTHLPAIAALRTLGKKDATALLAGMQGGSAN